MKTPVRLARLSSISYVLAVATAAFAQSGATCSFQAINLPGNLISSGRGINDAGAVVGALEENPRSTLEGFLLYRGKLTFFMFPGSSTTEANDINNHSQIVGTYRDQKGLAHGFVVHSGGFRTIDVPAAVETQALGINTAGEIVGSFTDASGHSHGFLHNGGTMVFTFPGAVNTQAQSINDH
jgi:probable HAF family extracellular repeat protein